MLDVQDLAVDEAIPRLAVALKSVLADAQVKVVTKAKTHQIDVRFDGLPAWKIEVVRRPISARYQMIETQIDLMPLCLASMSPAELRRLAANENHGLRGVTVLPLQADTNDGRSGLRVRAGFVAQKGRRTDEVENLAIDILTVLTFARVLEDRVTGNSIAGEFSFELYNSRFGNSLFAQPIRFVTTGQKVFDGSSNRVFAEIMKRLKTDFACDVRKIEECTSFIRASNTVGNSNLEILVKIPTDSPIIVAHVPLMKVEGLSASQIWLLLETLNVQAEAGHFEIGAQDGILSFTAWKHLTNDLHQFSLEHLMTSIDRAYAAASKLISNDTDESDDDLTAWVA